MSVAVCRCRFVFMHVEPDVHVSVLDLHKIKRKWSHDHGLHVLVQLGDHWRRCRLCWWHGHPGSLWKRVCGQRGCWYRRGRWYWRRHLRGPRGDPDGGVVQFHQVPRILWWSCHRVLRCDDQRQPVHCHRVGYDDGKSWLPAVMQQGFWSKLLSSRVWGLFFCAFKIKK